MKNKGVNWNNKNEISLMPILGCESQLNPPNVLDSSADGESYWSVVHTLPRAEKALARSIFSTEIGYFLPCTQSRSLIRGKIQIAYLPLFSGYLFVKADRDQTSSLLRHRQVASIQSVVDQVRLIAELRQVHALIASGVPLTAVDRLAPGMAVEIQHGPLRGIRGQILDCVSGRRFVVAVDFIRKGVSVIIDDLMLARCS